jgi:hypothetical protein
MSLRNMQMEKCTIGLSTQRELSSPFLFVFFSTQRESSSLAGRAPFARFFSFCFEIEHPA